MELVGKPYEKIIATVFFAPHFLHCTINLTKKQTNKKNPSLNNVIDGLADDSFHPLCVLLSHPLQTDAERGLFGAAVVSDRDIGTHSQH